MKSIFKKALALALSMCMVFSMLIVGTVAAAATDGSEISLPTAGDTGLKVDFVGGFDFAVSSVASAINVADDDYAIISGSVLADLATAYAAYKQSNAYTTDYVVLGLPTTAAKADIKVLIADIREASPLATVVVVNNSSAAAAAAAEMGGNSAKVLSATCADADALADFLAEEIIATVNNIATLIEQSSIATQNIGHLTTDLWQAVPMVSQEILDAGYQGGEGNQWGLWITYAPTGDGKLAFMTSDTSLVWRSTDGGVNWAPSSLGINGTAANGLVIDPNNTNRVLVMVNAATNSKSGLYLSTDMGETWKLKLNLHSSESHDCRDQLAFDGSSAKLADGSSSVAYWLTHADPDSTDGNNAYGLYKSTDGGATWTFIEGTDAYVGGNLDIDGSGNLYIATESGLYKSTNGGTSFTRVYNGQVYSLTTIAENTTYKNYVYFTTAAGLYTYNGSSYSEVAAWNTTEAMRYPAFLAVSPVNPKLMLVQDNTMMYYGSYSVSNEYWSMNSYYSTDGGKTWSDCSYPKTNVEGLWNQNTSGAREKMFSFSPNDANTVLSLGGDYMHKSTDGGKSWVYSANGYNSIKIGGNWNFNANNPNLIAMGAQDYNGGYSTDGGRTWNLLNWSGNPSIGHAYASYALTDKVVVGQRATAWLSSGGTSYIYETYDGGATFNRSTDYVITGKSTACGLPGNDKVVFIGEYRGVLNAAGTDIVWSVMNGCVGVYSAYETETGAILFGLNADGYIVYSTDGGFNWSKWTNEYSSTTIYDIAYNSKTDTVFIVESYWSLKAVPKNGIPYLVLNEVGASGVCVDPDNADIMYVASYNANNRTTKNVWRSIDAGMTWHLLSRTVGDGREGVDGANAANSCRVNPLTHELYVSTECNGVWRISCLPSIMYNGGLNYANLQKTLDIIDNLPTEYAVADSVRSTVADRCASEYVDECEQLNGNFGTLSAATALVENGDFVNFVDYKTNHNVTLNSSDANAFRLNRFGTTAKNYNADGELVTITVYTDTGRGVSTATYDLGNKFDFSTKYCFTTAYTQGGNSDNYIAIGGLYIKIVNNVYSYDSDARTQVFSLHLGSSTAPALATSSAIAYSTACNIDLSFDCGNVVLSVNGTQVVAVAADDFYAAAGDYSFSDARLSVRVYDGYNVNYFEGYELSTYYSAADLITDMAELSLPATAADEVEIIALHNKCSTLGADATAAVKAYFDGVLPTDAAIEDLLAPFYIAVDAIPSTITIGSEAAIKSARAVYDGMSAFLQGYAIKTAAYTDLTAAEATLEELFIVTPIVSVQGPGSVTADGAPYNAEQTYDLGTAVEYAAVAGDGARFIAWINNINGNILSYESVISVPVTDGTDITAVFGYTAAADEYTVLIVDRNNFVVQNTTVAAGASITMPTANKLTDYNFAGWSSGGKLYAEGASVAINNSAVFNAKYTPKSSSALYTITVGDNATKTPSAAAGGYAYNEAVTITADEIDGQYFAGWYKNDVLISYAREYTFYVTGNAHINAAYSDVEPNVVPIVKMTNVSARAESGLGIVTFIMERTMPESSNYIYVGSGLLVTVTTGQTLTLENVDNTVIKQIKSGYSSGNGQYKLNVKTRSGNAFARAYLTYVDVESGQTVTIYSDTFRGSVELGGIEWGETDF